LVFAVRSGSMGLAGFLQRGMLVVDFGGEARMRIQQSSHQGCVVLTLVGRLDLAAAPRLQRAILKLLAEPPLAIICDLSRVEGIDPLCAGVFTSMRHPAPGVAGHGPGAVRHPADSCRHPHPARGGAFPVHVSQPG